ncbi:MAG: T9SS type A sorting domain-containing protein [Bacteroidota bacterium]|nr:T9SS type A sorting domain-containing protein [Bacteroidota bacterium]
MYKSLLLVFLLLCFLPFGSYSQISQGGFPRGTDQLSQSQEFVKLEVEKVTDIQQTKTIEEPGKNAPYMYAHSISVNLNPNNSGIINSLPNGGKLWQVAIESEGASSISLLFDSFKLTEGAELFIYSPGKKWVLGAYTSRNNKESGMLATQPVPGDKVLVECFFPDGDVNRGKLNIGQVGHAFNDIFVNQLKDGNFNSSGSCNVNINCPEGETWQKEKSSVVRLSVYYEIIGKWGLCTGVVVNNVNKDGKPFLLTANHCIENQNQANTTVAVFNYESPFCDDLIDGSISQSVSGAQLKATNTKIDFSLVQLSKAPPMNYQPYYAGWNILGTTPTRTVSIHHPSGDVKKISIDNDSPVTGTLPGFGYDDNVFWNILEWDLGTTELGSSGAPLFDNNHLLIGTLVGGEASCANSINDYYQKISEAWENYSPANEQLKYWLDPEGTGTTFLTGLDPYGSVVCEDVDNIGQDEILILKRFTENDPDDGYWTGHNVIKTIQYADKIFNVENISLLSLTYKVGRVEYDSPSDHVIFKVWTGIPKPEVLVVSKSVPLSNFKDSTDYVLYFDSIYQFTGNFWVGYEIFYDSQGPYDQFAVFQVNPRSEWGDNTALFYQNGIWTTFSNNYWNSMRTSLGITAKLCNDIPSLGIPSNPVLNISDQIIVHPNPTSGMIIINFPENILSGITMKLYSLTGSLVMEKKQARVTGPVNLDMSGFHAGIYLLRLEGDGFVASKKISVLK